MLFSVVNAGLFHLVGDVTQSASTVVSTTASVGDAVGSLLNTIYGLVGTLIVSLILIAVKDIIAQDRAFKRNARVALLEKRIEKAYSPLLDELEKLNILYDVVSEKSRLSRSNGLFTANPAG